MSLADALLLEPYRDPLVSYIALRADQQKGTGRLDDPWDGGTRLGPVFTNATINFEPLDVTGYCFPMQLFAVSTSFVLSRVTGLSSTTFNGPSFTIAQLIDATTFRFQLPALALPLAAPPGPNGDVSNPALLGILLTAGAQTEPVRKLAWPVAKITGVAVIGLTLFDVVEISNSTTSYLNGRFVVVGIEADGSIWVHLSNAGSGIATMPVSSACACARVLYRFDEIMRAAPPNSVIHVGPGLFETRGRCQLFTKAQGSYPFDVGFQITTGQKLRGAGIGVTTVKLVYAPDPDFSNVIFSNFSSNGSAINYLQNVEITGFTLDCNLPGTAGEAGKVGQPGQPVPGGLGLAPYTCQAIGLSGDFLRVRRVRAINWGCQAAQETFVIVLGGDLRSSTGPVNNIVEDCIVESPNPNNTHENTLIGVVGSNAASPNGQSLIVRNNYVNGELPNGFSSQRIGLASISVFPMTPLTVKITTKLPHNLSPGRGVAIESLSFGSGSFNIDHSDYLIVLASPAPTMLDIYALWLPAPYPQNISSIGVIGAYMGTDFHPVAAYGGSGCVTEGNAVFDCLNGFYIDTGSTRDAIVRYNYFSGIWFGIYFNFNSDLLPSAGEFPGRAGDMISTNIADLTLANFVSQDDHFMKQGDVIFVQGAFANGVPQNPYNGAFSIASVPPMQPKQFTYKMRSAEGSPTDSGHPFLFSALWQVRRLNYESNYLDLYPNDVNSWTTPFGAGMVVGGNSFATNIKNPNVGSPPFIFPDSVFRDNLIRIRDNISVPPKSGNLGIGLRPISYQNTLIQENIIDLPNPKPVQEYAGQAVTAFGNQTGGGTFLPMYNDIDGTAQNFQQVSSLETAVADAMAFAFL